MSLHVYKNGVTEWFVAESKSEAAVIAEKYLTEVCGVARDEMDLDFVQVADTRPMTIDEEDNSGAKTMTAAEWAAHNGKGFLATTEY